MVTYWGFFFDDIKIAAGRAFAYVSLADRGAHACELAGRGIHAREPRTLAMLHIASRLEEAALHLDLRLPPLPTPCVTTVRNGVLGNVFLSSSVKDFFSRPKMAFAFFVAYAHCLWNFNSSSIKIPKSFSSVTCYNFVPFISHQYRLFFLPICKLLHLSILKGSCHRVDHSYILSRSSCNFLLSSGEVTFLYNFASICK